MKSYLVHMKLYVMEILPDKYYTELGITFVKSTGTGGQNIIWLFDHLILLVLSCFKQAKRCFFYLNETIKMRMDQSCKNLARSWKTCLFLLFDQPVFSLKLDGHIKNCLPASACKSTAHHIALFCYAKICLWHKFPCWK